RQQHLTRHRPQEEGIPIEAPPLISRELCERVQALRPVRQAHSRRNNTRHESRLRARINCPECGLAASGRPGGRDTSYGLNGHQSRVYTGRLRSCTVRSMRTERLDSLVWEDVCRVLSAPEIITEALRKAHAGDLGSEEGHERTRQLQRARQKVERQIERLVE